MKRDTMISKPFISLQHLLTTDEVEISKYIQRKQSSPAIDQPSKLRLRSLVSSHDFHLLFAQWTTASSYHGPRVSVEKIRLLSPSVSSIRCLRYPPPHLWHARRGSVYGERSPSICLQVGFAVPTPGISTPAARLPSVLNPALNPV